MQVQNVTITGGLSSFHCTSQYIYPFFLKDVIQQETVYLQTRLGYISRQQQYQGLATVGSNHVLTPV